MIFQDPMTALNPVLSIGRQMVDIQYRDRAPERSKRRRAAEMLERVGIADPERRLTDIPQALSGGMRQRVAIAMSLLNRPDLIIADELNVSRVPVREALRYLESYGIAVRRGGSRGVHLMPINPTSLRHTLAVRASLEKLAVREALAARKCDPDVFAGVTKALSTMERATADHDAVAHARADTEFHRRLCEIGGNEVLLQFWESLSRKLTIIFGLAAMRGDLEKVSSEHVTLLTVIESGKLAAIDAELDEHIVHQTEIVDFDAVIAARRAERSRTGG